MISFVETMSGQVVEPNGTSHPISFTVSATQERRGVFSLRGVAHAPPGGTEQEATGTLTMALFPPAIVYRLALADGRMLDAQKTPTVLAPLESMTFMPVAVRNADGTLFGEGSMRFALRDLPRFLASWLPRARPQQKRLESRRRAILRAELDA